MKEVLERLNEQVLKNASWEFKFEELSLKLLEVTKEKQNLLCQFEEKQQDMFGLKKELTEQISLVHRLSSELENLKKKQEVLPVKNSMDAKLQSFIELLGKQNTDLDKLQFISFSGVPEKYRSITWKLLLGYMPTCLKDREPFLKKRAEEYQCLIQHYFDTKNEDNKTFQQIKLDVPRTGGVAPLFDQETVQMAFLRILFIFAVRHPNLSYVQGMNDLAKIFYLVFIKEYIPVDAEADNFDARRLSAESLQRLESDSYWCFELLILKIQSNYIANQPGILEKVKVLEKLIELIDSNFYHHLKKMEIQTLTFSFRWMNNLLFRELPLACTIRLWDSYMSEQKGFETFHVYCCALFLTGWSKHLIKEKEFDKLQTFLLHLPTENWSNKEILHLVTRAKKFKDFIKHRHLKIYNML